MKTKSFIEPLPLKEIACPVVRIYKVRQRDKSISFSLAVALHVALLWVGGSMLIKSPQFAVEQGKSGIEVSLVAAPAETVVAPVVAPAPQEKADIVEKEPVNKVVKQEEQGSTGKDAVTAQSQGGALTEAKPEYLANPAPAYPSEARRKGWSGLVVLKVAVDKDGNPTDVIIEQSSGHDVLDTSASKTVKRWKFKPAKLGDMPVESQVKVPVRFDLKM